MERERLLREIQQLQTANGENAHIIHEDVILPEVNLANENNEGVVSYPVLRNKTKHRFTCVPRDQPHTCKINYKNIVLKALVHHV